MKEGISIIIPTLNEEKYIGKLLNCLVNQTYKDFEVIVIDGQSDDKTKQVVNSFKKSLDLKLIDSKKRNVAYQRNLGADKAKFERLLFLDADVIFKNKFLEMSLNGLEKDIIAIPKYIPMSKDIKYKIFFSSINLVFKLMSKIKPCGIGMCIFSSKKIHGKIKGFDESLTWTDDIDYVNNASKNFKYDILNVNIFISIRRFEQEGTRNTMKRWLRSYWYFLNNNLNKSNALSYFDKKRKLKLLLIQPKNIKGRYVKYPPLSIITLASLTPEEEFDIEIIDEQYQRINFNKRYDIVGITVQTILSKRAYQIADQFRSKGTKVILGGMHPTFLPDEALNHCDSLVLGEAEEIWNNLLSDFKNGKLKQKYYGGFIDMAHFPKLKKKYFKSYIITNTQVTRGCPNSCEYCSVRVFNGNCIRKRPINNVIEEIKHLTENKSIFPKLIGFVDDNLFADREYAKELFNRMIPLKVYWGSFAPITLAFDNELLDYAYKSGCRVLSIGFESINHDSIIGVKKFDLIDKYEEGIRTLKQKGIFTQGLFVFGFDGDRKDVVSKTIKFAIKNNLDEVALQILRPLPGTKLFEKLKSEGRITTFDWSKYEGCVIKLKHIDPKILVKDIMSAQKKFFSIRCIIKRMAGLKDYSFKRVFLYLRINIRDWWKTKMRIPV